MNSDLFKVKIKDIVDGLLSAILVAVLAGLYGIITADGFSVFTADWGAILNSTINWSSAAFLGYVGNIFLSNKEGKFLGVGPASTE